MTCFGENVQKLQCFTFNPRIKIFFKILAVSLSLFYGPPTSCKVSEKNNKHSPRYLKTDGQTD